MASVVVEMCQIAKNVFTKGVNINYEKSSAKSRFIQLVVKYKNKQILKKNPKIKNVFFLFQQSA